MQNRSDDRKKDYRRLQFINLKKQYKRLESDIDKRIKAVLEHGQFIMGPEIDELEKRLSKFSDSKYCLSCSSGTDALLISLLAQGISSGDKIITTPFTYIATAEVIRLIGATPVFVDIDSKTFNINPEKIDIALNDLKSVKGIIPVNLFGLPADFDAIYDVISCYDNIFVIEDAAQSFGAIYKRRKSCSLGNIGTTSFFPAKPLGCYGDGGAIFTNDDNIFEIMKSIRIHGQGKNKYDCDRIGLNGRMDTIQATILLSKLSIYEEEINLRQDVARKYSDRLKDYLEIPYIPDDCISVWAQYSVLLPNKSVRKIVIQYLQNKNIPSMIYYQKPLHIQKAFKDLGYSFGDFPVSESISSKILSLPMHPYLDDSEIDMICETIIKAV